MRIIDKNTDFYDYLQDSTDTLVFDRRGSFLLTKQTLCTSLSFEKYRDSKYRFLLLQCGATFWLFVATITKFNEYGSVKDCDLTLLSTWKNFDRPNELLKFDVVSFGYTIYRSKMYDYKQHDFVYDRIKENVKNLVDAVNRNDFKIESGTSYKRESNSLPLLKACGLGNLMDAQEVFCAIEEYFSIEKTKQETTEAKGTTNDIKITMHGFDTKTSFRKKKTAV